MHVELLAVRSPAEITWRQTVGQETPVDAVHFLVDGAWRVYEVKPRVVLYAGRRYIGRVLDVKGDRAVLLATDN